MRCAWHRCEKESLKGKFCSLKCKNKYYVDLKRKKLKLKAIAYCGGKCLICSYDKCPGALEFHHLDTTKKDFGVSAHGYTHSWEKVELELSKCILLCSNCHREVHAKLISL